MSSTNEMLGGNGSRRARIVEWILEHEELDDPKTKGRLQFDLGRGQSGQPEASVAFHPAPERLT